MKSALERLLEGRCYHMSEVTTGPHDLGPAWRRAVAAGRLEDDKLLDGFVACLDWPASIFWRQLSEKNPDAVILLSTRADAKTWWESMEATVLPVARLELAPDWMQGLDQVALLKTFTDSARWDDRGTLMRAYERHILEVRSYCDRKRLVEWAPGIGWGPVCGALGLPVPPEAFPWRNRREDWKVQNRAAV